MDFCIRAMSSVDCVQPDARTKVVDLLGKKIGFRAGLSYSLVLPDSADSFPAMTDPERVLSALQQWCRVFVYRDGHEEVVHVLAPFEDDGGDLGFYRVDFRQPIKPRRGPRPAAMITGGHVLTYEQCASWLIDLAQQWQAAPSQANLQLVVRRPSAEPRPIRIAWVLPALVGGRPVQPRLSAIAKVYGAEIVHVEPRGYRDTQARLGKSMPFDAVVMCRHFAPHISSGAVPTAVDRHLVLFCDSTTLADLEGQIRTWIEVTIEEVEKRRFALDKQEDTYLLALMLRAMLSHSKIGEYSHCPKENVLKVIRGRHLNLPLAEQILDANCERHRDNAESECIFLWKDHNDGRQYFLNPKRVERAREIAALVASS
jgi:hypothetical protein